MKIIAKRSLAWLMTLMMCVTLFCGVWTPAQAATVDYVYSGKYVYNWGVREETATFLSPMADAWYDKNNTSYEELSALSGASTTSGVPSSALYRELQDVMKSNHNYTTSYDATKNLFRYTDCQNSGGAISSFYSGKAIGPDWNGSWNREHTWPNSKGDASGQGENDIIMLRPTSTTENSSRGNKAYGESSGYYHPNSESNNKYDLRGDVARIMLFVYCRWGNTGSMWGSSGVMESREVLLKWVEEDPVDTWELGRNDAAESITGTRNVFVDYPELIFALFNEDVPEDYDTPSGIGAGVSYTITASSNNTAYGTVSVSGKTINATPKSGYMVSGYEIIGGDRNATVTRDGNAFKVSATSDVSIRINFAPRQQVSVQFSQQGSIAKTQTVYSGDAITLPPHTGTVPEGLTFVGWVAQTVEETTQKPTCHTAGSSYMVNSGITLYALYSRLDGEGAGNSDVYVLVTNKADLQIGDKIIICAVGKDVAMSTNQKSNNRGEQAVTPDGDSITLVEGVQVITIEAGQAANTYAFNVGNGYLYAASSSKNYLRTETTLSANSSWSIAIANSGVATIKSTGSFSRNWLRYNNDSSLFSCYQSGQADIALYKQLSGTVHYFTGAAPAVCTHEDAYEVAGKDATCVEAGYTAGVYCPDCDKYISGGAEIPATGEHTYDNACDADCNVCGTDRTPADHAYESAVTTAPTCGADGVRTYTCSACGDSYTAVEPATGEHTYDHACDADCNVCGGIREVEDHTYESAVTTAPTCGADGVRTYTCSVCGDSYTAVEPATGEHTYENACDADCNVCGAARTPAEHAYESTVTTAPTCGADGVRTYTCSVCGDNYTAVEPATGEHTYDHACDADCNVCGGIREVEDHAYESAVTTAPTCGADGVRTYTCSACGDSYTAVEPATGEHTYDNACDADCNVCDYVRKVGPHKYDNVCDADCNVCGVTRITPDHVYQGVITTLPTCGSEGVRTHTCIICEDTYTEVVRPTALHTYAHGCDMDCDVCGAVREVAPHKYDNACDADCNVCGATRTTSAHKYDNACDADCNVCGAARTPADHDYESAVTTAPTCTADGVCTYTCTACGDSYTEIIPAAHTYDNAYDADCNVCGETREVSATIRGDANGDGKLNMMDAGIFQQYLNGWDVSVYADTADMNGDGKLNNLDLVMLIRLLAGWNV